ncbi:MAG: hypothetical protein COA82_12130 [Alkaliphilus sp.]|nr:MAG: hypothetical protein COA82_12130 [Alkaliphilus sp.]
MNILRNKDGNAAILACAIVICLMLLFSVISEYFRLKIIAEGVRSAVQSSVISVAVQNYDEVFTTLREGYSGAFELDGGSWKSRVDKGSVMSNLSDFLGLVNGRRYSGQRLEYEISNLDVNILNTTFADTSNSETFKAEVFWNLEVPLSFGWDMLPPLRIQMKVKAGYTARF